MDDFSQRDHKVAYSALCLALMCLHRVLEVTGSGISPVPILPADLSGILIPTKFIR